MMESPDIILTGAMDFQKATAQHIFSLLTDPENPHRRVLLADEVGLGKTIVARSVVSLMREYQREVMHDDFYRVVYVCSNINIARQNIEKLGINSALDFTESRLSMQHFAAERKLQEVKSRDEKEGRMPEVIIPLTPSTSFDFRSSTGISNERALICVLLEGLDEFSDKALVRYLQRFFRCNVSPQRWPGILKWYRDQVTALGDEYRQRMLTALRALGGGELSQLKTFAETGQIPEWADQSRIISGLRRVFAEISLDQLEPDLVIMDEFQRFKNLLMGDNEQSLLAKKFFSDPETKVLLLSATPYKPYTTLDELTESGTDEHFSDFRQLMGFLQEGSDAADSEAFDDSWKRYNIALSHISEDTFDVVKVAKCGAEDALYGMMCRTERFNTGGVNTVRVPLEVTPEDIKSYFEARTLLDEINEVASRREFRTMPMDYVKSSPYLMSFMDRYKLKGFVRDNLQKIGKRSWDLLYLPLKKIDAYREVPTGNARLQYLCDELFDKGYNAERLLWVPASRPYYKTHGLYAKNAGFSKTLVFSSWEMVPRMVSCMVSYNAERLVMKGLWAQGKRPGNYYKAEEKKSKTRYGANRLNKFKPGENPLLYVSGWLASLYNPEDTLGMDIKDIRTAITPLVKARVNEIARTYCIPFDKRTAMSDLTLLMRLLDGEQLDILPERISEDAVENLVSAAIGSPAICAYRMSSDYHLSNRIADFFVKMFSRPDPAMIVDLTCAKGADNYIEAILEYCVEGNLQAVLDEFNHLLEGRWDTILEQGPMEVGTLTVEMQDADKRIVSRGMRTYLAIPFTNAKMEDTAVAHTSVLRNAFNSPFRPFVLTTTSVGQEGLDFHWYARKLLHWNLPSNPVDMEQREGRVNRYKCLSIRQRLGEHYKDLPTWDDIFEKAREEYKRGDSDIVPYWCLPPDFPDDHSKLVERIILEYPLSQDHGRYERLKKVLSLYRLTMGQPRQEELLEMLASSGLSEEHVKELLINLSPYYRDKAGE